VVDDTPRRHNGCAVFITAAGIAFTIGWLAILAHGIFDFSNRDALAEIRNNLHYAADILTRVPRNAGDVFPVIAFLLSGTGVGDCTLRLLRLRFGTRLARFIFATCLGQVWWLAFAIVAGSAGFLTQPVLGSLLGLGLAFGAFALYTNRREWMSRSTSEPSTSVWLRTLSAILWILLAIDLYLAFLGALAPEVQFDAMFYHLEEAKRYAAHGALYNLGTAQGTLEVVLPQNQEILYAVVYKLFGLHAAKLLSWANLPLAMAAISAFAVEFFSSSSIGLLANVLFAGTPVVEWSASTASNDLSLAPYTLLSTFAVLKWRETSANKAWLLVAGAFCGYSFGVKPFSLLSSVPLALFVAIVAYHEASRTPDGRNKLRAVAAGLGMLLLGGIIGGLPNLIREGVLTGDPLYPIAAAIVHSPFWAAPVGPLEAASIRAFGADTSWAAFLRLPWLITMQPEHYRNIIGPIFLFAAPFVLVYVLRKNASASIRLLAAYVVIWGFCAFLTGLVEARYAEGMFPIVLLIASFLALSAAGKGLFQSRVTQTVFALALVGMSALNIQMLVPFQRSALLGYVSGYVFFPWHYLYDGQAEREVQLVDVPMLEYANAHLNAARDKIYLLTDVDAYRGVYSDADIYDGISPLGAALRNWDPFSPDAYTHFKNLGIDYLAIYQGQQAQFEHSTLYDHARRIYSMPPAPASDGTPASGEILYAIDPAMVAHSQVAKPASQFVRHDNAPTVYRISPNGTYCIVPSMDEMNAFGGFGLVRVVSASDNFLAGLRPLSAALTCPWPGKHGRG
jgi:hypothetical protein